MEYIKTSFHKIKTFKLQIGEMLINEKSRFQQMEHNIFIGPTIFGETKMEKNG